MEPKFQTSFIPKSPVLSSGKEPSTESTKSVSLISIIAMILFIVSVVLSGGVFFYKKIESKAIIDLKEALALEKASFNESGIKDLILVSDQMKAVKDLLDKHLILSNIFVVMQSSAIDNIKFTEISFETLNEGFVKVSFEGEATSYEHIAKQAELFKSTGFLNDVSFYNMEIDKDGVLVFEGFMSVSIKDTSYKEILKKLSLLN